MRLEEMFVKPIDRDIKGVIKVGQGDDVNVNQELEEYVVTRELQKHFARFFSNYNKSIKGETDKMGVWISGFFGSGKSHFLKIISYLIGNKLVDGKRAIDYFIDDKKITDPIVLAEMKLAASVSTDVVLFNVDSKGEMNGKNSKDAIVSVFLKVFNEMQGFCASNSHLADLERELDQKGKYDAFKNRFMARYGQSWEDVRNTFDFIQDDVVETLSDIKFMSIDAARNWCEKAVDTYNFSIEDFAKLIRDYIDTKGDNHRVVFLVDEMGQYIGSDSKLMLNLQTVAEDLGTLCHGKAWIIVTSQEDIDSLMKIEGRNDFSKIQGRFDTRLSLSSSNVDEVIKKRILEKNETARQTLSALYDSNATMIKNLIIFNDTVEKKLYTDGKDFASVYPFVPYQFNLLGEVLTSIRKFGASGKHLAEGERSMLALFKESAVKIKNAEQGVLVPFNMFYDALENFLDHGHRGVISKAWENDYLNPKKLEECFDVNLLKTLFMIKYVKGISANVDNITSLMVSHIDNDRLALREKVEEGLKRLCEQMLIQRNGDIYIFLTDEEQEVNREIKNQDVQMSEVISKVSEMIFDEIYPEKKFKLPIMNNRYSFAFNQFVDDKPYKNNQNNEIGINILTPNWDGNRDKQVISLSAKDNVIVLLPEDDAFIEEILSFMKIEKYMRLNNTNRALLKHEEIKIAKNREVSDRKTNAKVFLQESLRHASVFADGQELQMTGKDVALRFNEALGHLVANMYSKLYYIEAAKNESDIRSLLKTKDKQMIMLEEEKTHNHLAIRDVQEYVARNSMQHMKTSLKSIIDRFTGAPYGFISDDISWLIAWLFNSGDVALYINNEQISIQNNGVDNIVSYLTKSSFAEKLLIDKRERATDQQLKAVQNVMKILFKASVSIDNEDSLLTAFKKKADELRYSLDNYEKELKREPRFPGLAVIQKGQDLMLSIRQISFTSQLFEIIGKNQDDYLNFADDFEPIETLFEGEQINIFRRAIRVVDLYNDSKTFIADNQEIGMIVSHIKDIIKMTNPYGEIHKLPDLITKYTSQYSIILERERKPVVGFIDVAYKHVFDLLIDKPYQDEFKSEFDRKFNEIKNKTIECHNIAVIHSIISEIDVLELGMLNKISNEDAKIGKLSPDRVNSPLDQHPSVAPTKKIQKNINIKTLYEGHSWKIEKEQDIDDLIALLKESMMERLQEDKNTIINVLF